MTFLLIVFLVNCCIKYNERRSLVVSLILNLISLLIFADYNLDSRLNQNKYLIGFAFLQMSNLLIESAAVTFIMKNLIHYVPSNSYFLNAGFYLEFIEVVAKFITITTILLGLYLD